MSIKALYIPLPFSRVLDFCIYTFTQYSIDLDFTLPYVVQVSRYALQSFCFQTLARVKCKSLQICVSDLNNFRGRGTLHIASVLVLMFKVNISAKEFSRVTRWFVMKAKQVKSSTRSVSKFPSK